MARITRTQRQEFERLSAKFEPLVRDAFLAVAKVLTDGIDYQRLIDAIKANSVNDVIRALNVRQGSFAFIDEAISEAFIASGVATMSALPVIRDADGFRLNFQFNVRNIRAERRLREHVRGLIQDFTKEAEAAVRIALSEGLALGRNPQQVARQIAGVYDAKLGKRVGGSIGLNRNQAEWVQNAMADLRGETIIRTVGGKQVKYVGTKQKFLARTARDKRFDRTILKAISGETSLDDSQIDKMITRYADRLLTSRADMIGRTEVHEALNKGRLASYDQISDETGTDPNKAVKVWKATSDNRTRYDHAEMQNAEVVGLDTPFIVGGEKMLHPGDSSLGATAGNLVSCRCSYFVRLAFFSKVAK